ncbi:TniQ family protein [Burkholderia cenocepacia]|nr:TniQ family protein [Burkholderia cenocepacia]
MLRISEVNVGPTADQLLQAVFGSKARFPFEQAGQFADYCRAAPSDVCTLSGYWQLHDGVDESMVGGFWIPRRPHIVRSCSALCPACLEDAPYSRAAWEIALVSCCPWHGTMLVDRCSQCGLPISIRRKKVCQCRCGHDYREIRPDTVPEGAIKIAHNINNIIWRSGKQHSPLGMDLMNGVFYDVTPLIAFRHFWFLGVTFPAFVDGIPTYGQRTMSKARSIYACEKAALIMHDWPKSFFDQLEGLHRIRSREGIRVAERVLRGMWQQIVMLTRDRDVINMRSAFQPYVRSFITQAERRNSLKICINQREFKFE